MASRLIAKTPRIFCSQAWLLVPRRLETVGQTAALQTDNLFVRTSLAELTPKFKNPIAGRKYIPGSQDGGFPEFLAPPTSDLPYALTPLNPDRFSVEEWAVLCQDQMERRLLTNGALLFRGLPLSEGKHFARFVKALKYTSVQCYAGGTGERVQIDGEKFVFKVPEEPSPVTLEPHNEMAYFSAHPMKAMFFCLKEPGEDCGGLTPVASNREILSKLDPDVVTRFKERGVRYIRYLPSEKNAVFYFWQQSFYTEDPKEVERALERDGFQYKWCPDTGDLCYWNILPPTKKHPKTGEEIWFNQIVVHHNSCTKESPMYEGIDMPEYKYPYHTTYGDGSAIESEIIQYIRKVIWENTIGFQWKNGDFLVLENMLAHHARLGFTGEREILSYFTVD